MALITTPSTEKSRSASANQVGTVPAASAALGITADEYGVGAIRTTRFTLNAASITWTDATTNGGQASVQLYTFPKGILWGFQGCGILTTITPSLTAVANAGTLLISVGTVTAATDATLSSTEANFIPSTSATIASTISNTNLKPTTGLSNGAAIASILDGSSSAISLWLNFAASATDSLATVTGTGLVITGTIDVTWMSLGTTASTLT